MYTPSSTYTPNTDKANVRWISDTEAVTDAVTNRPIEDVADMVLTVKDQVTIDANATAIAMAIALS